MNNAFRFAVLFALASLSTPLAAQPTQFSSRGPGGGGALFLPSFNPGVPGELSLACDMSESFHSTNYGREWTQTNFKQLQVFNNRGLIQYSKDGLTQYTIDVTTMSGSDAFRPTKSTDGGKTWKVMSSDPTGAGAQYLYSSYKVPNTVLVADYKTIYISTNGGGSWRAVYTTNNSAGIHIAGALFFEPDIFIGLSTGVLYSSDAGSTFQYRKDITGLDTSSQAIFSFTGGQTVGLRTTTTLYAAVHASGDVYGGVTALDRPAFEGLYVMQWDVKKWNKKVNGISVSDQPYFVSMSAQQESICYAAGGSTNSVPIVLKTTDAGEHWTETFNVSNNQNIATGWSGAGGDRQWSYGEVALGFHVNPANKDEAVFTDFGYAHITRDGGATWSQAYVSTATQNPAGNPTPKGRSYESIGLENTTCWHVVWVDSLNLFGCFSDIQGTRSTDGGRTWGFQYTGHSDNSMYHVVKHPQSGMLYGATSTVHDMYQSTYLQDSRIDNGKGKILYSSNNGAAWQLLHDFAHPVVWLALDRANPKRMYASVIHSTQGGVFVCNNIDAGSASTWTKLANPPRTEGHPFNLVVLNDGSLLATYSGRRDGSGKFTASSGVFLWNGSSWSDKSDGGMQYWTKDIVVDPNDATQNTWYVCVFSGWGGAPNGKGGLYRSVNRGGSWVKINSLDRVTSLTFDPKNTKHAYMTTETDGLWYFSDITTASPTPELVEAYPFRQPERVFFNPFNTADVWVSSFGNGMKTSAATQQVTLDAPTLLLPRHDTSLLSRKVLFTWKSSWSPSAYRIQMSKDSTFTTMLIDERLVDPHRAVFFTTGDTYYWRVKSYSATDSSSWSERWRVYVPSTIPAAAIANPICGALNVAVPPTLEWTRPGAAYQYFLVIATDSLLKDIVLDTTMFADYYRCIFTQAKKFTRYYWCVYDRGVESGGEASDTCSFVTGDVGADVVDDGHMFSITPSPVHEVITVKGLLREAQRVTIILCDELGREVQHEERSQPQGLLELRLSCAGLNTGLYGITIKSANGLTLYHSAIIIAN